MKAPFLHLAICLLTGLLLSAPGASTALRVVAGLLAVAYLLALFRRERATRLAWAALTALFVGLGLPHLRMPWQPPPLPALEGRVDLYGQVDSSLERGRRTERLYLRMRRAEAKGRPIPLGGRTRLTLYWTESGLRYGDSVLIRGVRLHRPKGFRNPGTFDFESYLKARGVMAVGGVSRPTQIVVLERGRGSPPLRVLYGLRRRLVATFRENLPREKAEVLSALIYGERRGVPRELQEDFYASGTGHLLAISGLHVGFVAFFLYRVLLVLGHWTPRGLRVRLPSCFTGERLAALGTIPFVLAYMVLAGGRVTTVRATVMVGTYLLAKFLQRDRNHFNTLGLAAVLILLWDARFLFDAGFQLSFLAVLTILVGVRNSRSRGRVRDFVRVTVLVSLAMIPMLAIHFHRVSLYSVAANLALVPVASLLIPAGLVTSALGALWPAIAAPLFLPVHGLILFLVEGARWFARLPHASLHILPPTALMLVGLYGAAAAWFLLQGHKAWRGWAVGASLALLSTSILWSGWDAHRRGSGDELRLIFLDVGDADATFVRLPDGRTLLVDAAGKTSGGFDVGDAVVVPFLRYRWVRRLDYALLTHPERDHAGGFLAVLRNLAVGQLWESGLDSTKPLRERVLEAARKRGVAVRRVLRGDVIPGRGYRVEVLHPARAERRSGSRQDNDRSVILRLVHGKVRVLLASDLERRGERELVRSGENLSADVLRVPHHGSSTSSSWAFLRQVRPRAAVISAGRPWWGHPSRRVLGRFRHLGIAVFRTDEDGAVELRSDGQCYTLRGLHRPYRHFQAGYGAGGRRPMVAGLGRPD